MASPLYLGLDAGGTKTAAVACLAGDPSARRHFAGDAAQATRDGAAAAAASLARLIDEARAAYAGVPLGGVVVGMAGAGAPETQEAVRAALAAHVGGARVLVTHDAEIALDAAWGTGSGAVLIVGTGSVVHARTVDGVALRAGGWGPALGDDGSGTALGRAALRGALAAWDGGPPTALAEVLAERHGLADARAVIAAAHAPGARLSAFADVLLAAAEADDWVATQTLAREANALAQQAGWLATAAGDALTPRLALAGGLTRHAVYVAPLRAALDRHLPGWTVADDAVDPVDGALARALREAEGVEA